MAKRNMAQLMRDHALHFIGGLGSANEAAMDINILCTGNKGVNAVIINHHDIDILRAQASGNYQIMRHVF